MRRAKAPLQQTAEFDRWMRSQAGRRWLGTARQVTWTLRAGKPQDAKVFSTHGMGTAGDSRSARGV